MLHTPPVIVEPSPEEKQTIDRFLEKHADDPVGNVADRVLFEDDNVRIWEMKLEPGQHSDLHHHEHDYYLVVMSGDRVAGVTPKGSPMDSFVGLIPPEGNTVAVPKGGTEWALNTGKQTYHEFLIELKKT